MFFGLTNFATGFAVGYGFGFFTREIVRTSQEVIRPIAKKSLLSTIAAYEKSRESIARFGERLEDLVAEVREEDSSSSIKKQSRARRKSTTTKPPASGRTKKAAN